MSITATVTEDPGGRGLTADDEGYRSGTRVFLVVLDLSAATAAEKAKLEEAAELALPVQRYQPHPSCRQAIARTLSVKPVDGDWTKWRVEVGYDSKPFAARGDGSDANNNSASPSSLNDATVQADQRPPEVATSTRSVTEVLEYDAVTGARIVNSAGDPFDPPLEAEVRHHVFTYKFYRLPAQLNWAQRAFYLDCVNADTVVIFGAVYGPEKLRCMDVTHRTVWDKGPGGLLFLFFELSVVYEYDPKGWNRDVLDAGKREKIVGPTPPGGGPNPVTIREIRDDTGQVVSDPQPLGGGGLRLPPGQPFVYLKVKRYRPQNIMQALA